MRWWRSVLVMMVAMLAISNTVSGQYEPQAPPQQVYDYSCESTENDPDADCIFGVAGKDYPTLEQVPNTKFTCSGLLPGIYADPDAACQVYHMCMHDGNKHSFLCPRGTLFNQEYFVCDLWFNVDCDRATSFYSLNEYIYKDPEPKEEAKISYV